MYAENFREIYFESSHGAFKRNQFLRVELNGHLPLQR